MISLTYKGRAVLLYPDTDVSWEIEDDFLDYDTVGTGYSLPIRFPREGNEWIFHHAADPDHPESLLQVWDGFQIRRHQNIWWDVSLDLDDADGVSYSGSLTGINRNFVEAKNKKIADLVSGAVTYGAGTYASIITATNTLQRSDIRWPWLHFHGQRWLSDPQVSDLYIYQVANTNEIGMLLPTFTMEYILRNILQGLGMDLVNSFADWTGGQDTFSNLLLVHNRVKSYNLSAGISVSLADHVPDMTLQELIQDLAILSCSSINIRNNQQTLEIRSILQDVSSSNIRLSLKNYDKDVRSRRADINNVRLSWDLSADQRVEALTVEKLEGQDRGPFATITAWMALSTPAAGDYGYVKSLDAYYRVIDQNGSLVSAFYSYTLQEYSSGEDRAKDLQPKLLPVTKDDSYYQEIDGSFQISNSGGAILISGFGDWTDYPSTLDKISFDESSSEKIYAAGYYSIVSVNGIAGTITLSANSYISEVQISKLLIKKPADAVIPIAGGAPHAPEIGQDNESFAGRVMIWHGMVSGGPGSYPYASADVYDKDGSQISKMSLSWSSPAPNLRTSLWSSVVSFFKQARYITLQSSEPLEKLQELYINKKARLVSGAIRLKRFRTTISKSDQSDQEIEGWII